MTRQTAFLPVLIALAGTVLGFVLGIQSCGAGASSGSAASSREQALAPGDSSDLLAPLLAEVRALGDRMAELVRARPGGPAPTSALKLANEDAGEGVDVSEVTRLLERCTTLIERLERRTQSGGGGALQLVNPLADPKGMLLYLDDEEGVEERFTRDHLLLSYQQVLDRYGQPDVINATGNGQARWLWELQLPGGDTDYWTLYFLDGRVSRGEL